MTVTEKLRLIKENMTRVYEAGIKLGTETSGLLNVSLLDLNAEGNVVAHTGTIKNITDKSVLVGTNVAEVDIFISGYVEFSLHLTASAYAVVIDGKEYHANAVDEPFKAEDTVHFSGKVLDKIRISGYGFEDITFEYFVKGAIAIEEIFNNGQLAGEESGQKSEYDRLTLEVTNNMTVNNTRVHYTNIFSYGNWGGFKFAYPIKPTGNIAQMFYNSPMTELPKQLDFSEIMTKASTNSYTYRRGVFAYCTNLKEIDFSAETGINMRAIDGLEEWFAGCRKLETIKGLNVYEGTIFNTSNSNGAFYICDALVNLTFANGSVIGKSLDIHWSTKLSAASYYDIIRHLSPTITGCILTVPINARESYDATNGEGSWDMTLQMWCPSNWTIAYA